jgi:hypothetical protein
MLIGSVTPAYAAGSPGSGKGLPVSALSDTDKAISNDLNDVLDKSQDQDTGTSTVGTFNAALGTNVKINNGAEYASATFVTGFDDAVVVQETDGSYSFPTETVVADLPSSVADVLADAGVNFETGEGLEKLEKYVLAVFNPTLNELQYFELKDIYNPKTGKITLPFGGLIALVEKGTNTSEPTETVE